MQFQDRNTVLRVTALVGWLSCSWLQGEPPRIERIVDPSRGFDALQDVLEYANVREALDIRPEQHLALQRLNSAYKTGTRLAMGNWRELPVEERTAERLQDELRDVRRMVLPGIEQALDNSQFKRLQQLQFQLRVRRGLFAPLYSQDFASELQLSPDQLRGWKGVIAGEQTLYREEIAEVRGQLPKALMRVLTPEQRQKYRELFGDSFHDSSILPKIDGRRIAGRGFPPMLDLLRYPSIRHDLEIVDEQQESLSKLLSDYRAQERELTLRWRARDTRSKRAPSRDENARREELRRKEAETTLQRKELEGLLKSTRVLLDEILLPHQTDRLEQLILQARAQSQSNIWLITDVVAEAIELTPEQREKLRETIDVESTKAQVLATRLYNETLDRILQSLMEEQRVRYTLLVGAPFALAVKD